MINDSKAFETFANKIAQTESLYLAGEEVLEEPEELKSKTPIPQTLKVHKVVRDEHGVFCNRFFLLQRG